MKALPWIGLAAALIVATSPSWLPASAVTLADLLQGRCLAWFTPATASNRDSIGKPFTLHRADGSRFTAADLAGQPTLLMFGYTACPDVCPTTLATLHSVRRALGADAERLRMLFVTVDPERDEPQRLTNYLAYFDAKIVALSGTVDEVASAEASFGVSAKKIYSDSDSHNYMMDHSSALLLFDAQGRFVEIIEARTSRVEMAQRLRELIKQPANPVVRR